MAASLCKSQQCSIERRGFRQELDSWRHKLIHCVGFESILEGLFGPGLLNDISIYKDCEPAGVCDWSFDENCLFCCLRREKVKEHLADLHKPVTDVEPDNLLKHEKLKIIRLEKQAEEFINAVFYKKDTPRVSDPSIPLVAREIMQRMIRQFAAEYTSKNSCTQDSSQPNSTNNQSLQTPSPGQTSPPPATTQNPVLSKLLMADQDSPLDLTVKKSLSEDACEQEEGVLDLSTKKSPRSGSTTSSTSPSTSNAIGNGISSTEKVRNPNATSLTLENFMVKLCTPHQKQFINVLNNICTEDSSNQENSTIVSDQQNLELDGKEYTKTIFDPSLLHLNKLVCHTPANSPTDLDIKDNATDYAGNQAFLGLVPEFLTATERPSPVCCSVTKCTLLNCSFLSTDHGEQTTEKKLVLCMKTSEEQYKIHNMICQTNLNESCFAPQTLLLKDLSDNTQDSEFDSVIPKISVKENAPQASPKSFLLHTVESDCKLKQATSENTADSSKDANCLKNDDINSLECCHHRSDFLPSSCKNGLQENIKPCTSNKKYERLSSEQVSSDDQNDLVYINHPVCEARLENQNSALYTGRAEQYSSVLHCAAGVGIPEALSLASNKELKELNEPLNTIPLADPSSKKNLENQLEPQAIDSSCGNLNIMALGENCLSPNTLSNLSARDFGEEMIQCVNEGVESCTDFDLVITPGLMCNAHKSIAYENVPVIVIPKPFSVDVNNSTSSENLPVFNTAIEEPQPSTDESVSLACCNDIQNNNLFPPICCSNLEHSGNLFQCVTFSVEGPGSEYCTDTANVSSFCKGDLGMPEIHVEKCSVLKNVGTSELLQKTVECSAFPNIKGMHAFSCKHIDGNSVMGTRAGSLVESALISESERFSSDFSGSLEIEREYLSEGNRIDHDNFLSTTNKEVEDKCPDMLESFQVKLRCSTAANNLDESSMIISIKENIPSLLSSSAEHSVTGSEKETAIEEGQNCEVTTFSNENSWLLKSLNEEKTINTYNLKPEYSFNDKISSMSLKKKSKKVPVPSDRCLRSRHTQESIKNCISDDTITDTLQNPNLQIYVSMLPGTNNLERIVEVRSKTKLKSNLNSHQNFIQNLCEKTIDNSICEKNDSALILRNSPAKEMDVYSDNCLSNKISLRCKQKEKVKICVNVDSKERRVYFPSETNHLISTDDKGGTDLKVDTQKLTATSHSFRARKENKHRAKQWKNKSMALWNCSSAPLSLEDANKQPNRKIKAQHTGQQSQGSLNAVSLNDTAIPNKSKFVEWCSEEENQELIANFNNKYMSIHKSWIPLEKETPNVQKSKNKSDKLKEIWKTKKRLRKNRSTQESQKCSAMQILFLSTLNFSETCKYFLETTETRSLVIVKKVNTRLPEDLPLPIFPMSKYPSSISYHHTLQAERLKKHLKKFASVFPTRNNHKTKEALVNLIQNKELQHGISGFVGKGECNDKQKLAIKSEKSLVHLNSTVWAQGKKCNSVHGKLQHQALSVPYAKSKHGVDIKESNPNSKTSNRKGIDAKLSLEVKRELPKHKTADKQRGQKRSKEDLIKSGAHLTKKRKTEVKCSAENMLISYSKLSLRAKKVIKVKLDSDVSVHNKQMANKIGRSSTNGCLKNKKAAAKKVSAKVQLVGFTSSAKTSKIKSTKRKHFLSKVTKETITASQIKRTAEKMLTRSLSKGGSVPPQQKKKSRVKTGLY
ncbi:uncharacterized protein lcor.L isoform X1 [Xenopus laevis]|uniref:Uncharacterized protein lcor.L isoform X1 n=1 Tax=Xenopus laevis TaxID=8355 RepID=A0A8J0TAQ2_XENLA|nr:uncharacterized protein lcor.L isoform X1 [Xenopus laevis]